MSAFLRQPFFQLALLAMALLALAPTSTALPAAFRNRLFDVESSDASPEFARPDESSDLQRNSARLHRTLFLLDTSDLLKNARIFGEKSPKEASRAKRDTTTMVKSKTKIIPYRVPRPPISALNDQTMTQLFAPAE